jgi:hypothetical protein
LSPESAARRARFARSSASCYAAAGQFEWQPENSTCPIRRTSGTGEGRIDLGIIDVDPKPALHLRVSFKYAGKLKEGVVDQISPHAWEKRRGIIPRIHVTLSEGE